jgi:hypothetical protein
VFNGKDTFDETFTSYTITNSLTNVATSNGASSTLAGTEYSATLTADDGYILSNVTVTMGGVDVTESVYSAGIINITSVTADVVITAVAVAEADTTVYSITNNLTNVSTASAVVSVEENSTFTTTLTADAGYTLSDVTVTMGGTDVTADVYADGVVSITAVTGNVVITAVAVSFESVTITNLLYTMGVYIKPATALTISGNNSMMACTSSEEQALSASNSTYTLYPVPIPVGATCVTCNFGNLNFDGYVIDSSGAKLVSIGNKASGTIYDFSAYTTAAYLSLIVRDSADGSCTVEFNTDTSGFSVTFS